MHMHMHMHTHMHTGAAFSACQLQAVVTQTVLSALIGQGIALQPEGATARRHIVQAVGATFDKPGEPRPGPGPRPDPGPWP
jgi:hypothetical protein